MLNSKNYSLFLIPYLTVVCSLYHIIYYGLFGLNGLDFISAGDIIKSAVYPVLLSFLFASIGVYISHKAFYSFFKPNKEPVDLSQTSIPAKIGQFFFLTFFNSLLVVLSYFIFKEVNYTIVAFCVGNIFFSFLNPKKLFDHEISLFINRELLLMILLYLPCFSVATAIQDADNILSNKSFKYTTITSHVNKTIGTTTDTLKLIGMTENNFMFIDLSNKQIHFIKSDSMALRKK